MKNYLVLFREPDGRTGTHTPEEIALHQQHWKDWFAEWGPKDKLAGGNGLTLNGTIITPEKQIQPNIHYVGTEIVGGFLLLKAEDLNEATAIAASCPIYEFGGYAEVREMNS